MEINPSAELLAAANGTKFQTIIADPPWRFTNRTGKMAPEHRRLNRYGTMDLPEIKALPVANIVQEPAHLTLRVVGKTSHFATIVRYTCLFALSHR